MSDDLEIPPAPPAPTCAKCDRRHLADRECVPLTKMWWQTGAWIPPKPRTEIPRSEVFDEKTMLPNFNPGCLGRHDRTCWDLSNCDACIAYTRDLWEARARAKHAVDVEPRK